jgi:hypothetical protein
MAPPKPPSWKTAPRRQSATVYSIRQNPYTTFRILLDFYGDVIHACRKRRLKWVANLPLWDINTEAWSSGMGVGRGADNPTM